MTAVEASAGFFPGRPDGPRARQAVIDAHPELRERELIKLEGLVAAIAAGLARRDVPTSATSPRHLDAVAVFRRGFERWIGAQEGPDLGVCIREALTELKALVR